MSPINANNTTTAVALSNATVSVPLFGGEELEQYWVFFVALFFIAVLLSIGSIGLNSVVMFISLRPRLITGHYRYLIAAVSINDVLFVVFAFSNGVYLKALLINCVMVPSVFSGFSTLLVLVALTRYIGIYHAQFYEYYFTKRVAIVVTIVWFALPFAIHSIAHIFPSLFGGQIYCGPYSSIVQLMASVIALATTFALNIAIFCKIYRHSVFIRNANLGIERVKETKQVTNSTNHYLIASAFG